MEHDHTPAPWHLDGYHRGKILAGKARSTSVVVAEIPYLTEWKQGDPPEGNHATFDHNLANAEHIVRCVNSHDALVDALRFMYKTNQHRDKGRRLIYTEDELEQARAALALALAEGGA